MQDTTTHELRVVAAEWGCMPYCPCGWVGAAFRPSVGPLQNSTTAAYREHVEQEWLR